MTKQRAHRSLKLSEHVGAGVAARATMGWRARDRPLCKGGLGRAGTTAALLSHAADPQLTLDEVVTSVRKARPQAIETVTQERYLQRAIATSLKTS